MLFWTIGFRKAKHKLLESLAKMNPNPVSYSAAFKTELCGMSVKFSLFDPTRLAVSSSANFGIVGKGK